MGFWVWALANKNSKDLIFFHDNFDVPNFYFSFLSLSPGPIEHNTGYIFKAETCTNILRYNTYMSSYPGDRKWMKIEP